MAISGLLAVNSQPYPTIGAAAPEARTRDLLGRSLKLYPLRHELVVLQGFDREYKPCFPLSLSLVLPPSVQADSDRQSQRTIQDLTAFGPSHFGEPEQQTTAVIDGTLSRKIAEFQAERTLFLKEFDNKNTSSEVFTLARSMCFLLGDMTEYTRGTGVIRTEVELIQVIYSTAILLLTDFTFQSQNMFLKMVEYCLLREWAIFTELAVLPVFCS
ncbi:unnamed protein product [Schistocephalus solidus]|uniref:Cytochrome P450 n=1 Tax=Schistocephalus solidus TaxID=70667 RepID=A0A183S765_SCHSO|nr:unnamed protein product [Schistocephalus solidus]